MSSEKEHVILTLILLVAAGFRLWGLGDVPPGLSHDEVANWLIAQDILDGNHAFYFTAAYGHEPLYQYAQAATVALFGDHWLGLRWPSVAFSLLGLAATYTLVRYLFDVRLALLAVAWLSISLWPLFYARVAYRAIQLPFLAALSAYFFLQVILQYPTHNIASSHRTSNVLLAGLFLGLSLYTYTAARILPFILAAVAVYVRLVHTRKSIPWTEVLLVFLVATVVAAPFLLWLASHAGAESRVAEVREPLDRLLAGDPSLVWQNLVANLKFFFLAGDPWPRYNLPGRPVFAEPIGAALFFAGVLIALWHWRDPRYGFLLIWSIGALIPSVVTSDAPSSIRDILGLVVVFVFPAVGAVQFGDWMRSKVLPLGRSMSALASGSLQLVMALALLPCLALTARDYFVRWPQNAVVRFDYQADLNAVGDRLTWLPAETGVAVSGLSVHTMDGPSLELVTRREVTSVRLCDTRETLIIPSSCSEESWLIVPDVVPLDEDLQEQLMNWGAHVVPGDSFTSYRLLEHSRLDLDLAQLQTPVALPDGTSVRLPALFGDYVAFLGYKKLDRTSPSDPLTLLTYWRVKEPPVFQLKAFAHLVDASGEIAVQDDGLASPSDRWRPGDVLIQKHVLNVPSDSPSLVGKALRLGLYEHSTGKRLAVLNADHLQVHFRAEK